jgi:hypothetical protein
VDGEACWFHPQTHRDHDLEGKSEVDGARPSNYFG